jgi:hypothetical protein
MSKMRLVTIAVVFAFGDVKMYAPMPNNIAGIVIMMAMIETT